MDLGFLMDRSSPDTLCFQSVVEREVWERSRQQHVTPRTQLCTPDWDPGQRTRVETETVTPRGQAALQGPVSVRRPRADAESQVVPGRCVQMMVSGHAFRMTLERLMSH